MESASPSSGKVTVKQLPLYESCCGGKTCKSKTPAPSILESYVREAREECEGFINPIVGDYPQKISQELQSSVKLAKESIEYLQDENNQAARAAYITAVGFLGFIIARRGIIKRTTYALIGAGAAAALCNPPLAKDYAEISYSLAKKKVTELYDQYGGVSYEDIKKLNLNPFESKSDSPAK